MKQDILDYLMRPGYKPQKAKQLSKKLGVKKAKTAQFESVLADLVEDGQIRKGRNGHLRPRAAVGLIAGTIKKTRGGSGFLIPHEITTKDNADDTRLANDIFVAPRDMQDAQTGDEALVRLLDRRRSSGQRCGVIEEIVERGTHAFVGVYFERSGHGYVQIDGTTFRDPIPVGDPGAKGANDNDKVVVEMLRFPSNQYAGEAVLTTVLGLKGQPGVDTLSIINEFGLRDEFPEDVLEEARIAADQFDETELLGRRDLTGETIVTIDPADARDFDDAISLTRSQDNHWHLGIHIADVAHFVPEGSRLDREARLRGTSVYLPGRVLPMLPEIISNGLASLQQDRVRYAKTVVIEFNPDGIPLHTEFVNSAIKVSRRFAYEQVMPIIRNPDEFKKRVNKNVRGLLSRMHDLAIILRKRRFIAGSLELNLPEVKLEFDKDGRVTGAHESEHDESHQIIEEFMLAANTAVATKLQDQELLFLRRIHPDPDFNKLRQLADFVEALGYRLKKFQSRHSLQELLKSVRGQPSEHAINFALLRSLRPASYSGEETGHYALAIENYCHFTSPIRRYPDLTIHRLLERLANDKMKEFTLNAGELARDGKHYTDTERKAEKAERELTKVKLLSFMEARIGDEFDAVITGVERFGIFCQVIEIPVDGLVHISAISKDDYYYYDAVTMSLIGRRRGRQFRLGDQVRVRIAHVDVDQRELDLQIVENKSANTKRKPTRQDKSKPNSEPESEQKLKPKRKPKAKPKTAKPKPKKPKTENARRTRKKRKRSE